MSMVLMNAQAATWPVGAIALAALIVALLFVVNIGGGRPHS